MHTLTRFALCTSLILLTATLRAERPVVDGATVGEWTMDFDAAKILAKDKNLPLLLNFTGSDWCGWCKLMDANVFSKDQWKNYAKSNLVLVFIDFPRDKTLVPEKRVEANKALSKQFGVKGYPTYIVLASDGEKQLGTLGADRDMTPEKFIRGIKQAVEWPAKLAKLSPEDKASHDKAKAGIAKVEKELKAWIETKPERNEENNKKFSTFMEQISAFNKEIEAIMDRQK